MRRAFTLIELLVVITIAAVLAGLSLAAVQRVRASAARAQCQNNIRQIGLALHGYHDANRMLPPGCSFSGDREPYPYMSWLTRILPYLEQAAVWQQATAAYQQQSFFLSPAHHPILGYPIRSYYCPGEPFGQPDRDVGSFHIAFTSYLGVSGTDYNKRDGTLFLNSNVSLSGITDGTSQTVVVGERPRSHDGNFGWWYAGWGQSKDGSVDMHLGVRELNISPRYSSCQPGPYHFTRGQPTDQCDAFHFWSSHYGGANFLFGDGSVRFLHYSADPILPALATRAGGESVTIPD